MLNPSLIDRSELGLFSLSKFWKDDNVVCYYGSLVYSCPSRKVYTWNTYWHSYMGISVTDFEKYNMDL